MGYKLTIGEARVISFAEDGIKSWCEITANPELHGNAPAFGEATDYTNSLRLSYISWSNFCKKTELYDVFYDQGGIRGGNPGAVPVSSEMVERVNNALDSYKGKSTDSDRESDRDYCRLIWLHYWVNWAFHNCRNPVFANS